METKYIDFLLVEKQDGSLILVTTAAHKAEVGCIVEFNRGLLGRVIKKAWAGEQDGEMVDLITSKFATFEAEAIYGLRWKKEADDGTVPGNP